MIEWKDSKKYEGNFEKGQYHGRGKFTWPTGGTYEGEYINGLKDGAGVLTMPGKFVIKGVWGRGELLKTVEATDLIRNNKFK